MAEYSTRFDAAAIATEPHTSSSAAEPIAPVIASAPRQRFHWKPALEQSFQFLMVMHAFRLATEPSTRAELKGPFWGDYADSILGTDGWGDGDPFMVNYIGHPLEGSVAGFIYLQNDDAGRTAEFGANKAYWHSRLKAAAWSAAFSLQFELGPISEASIGNVGKQTGANGQTYMGTVDLVVTPLMGMGWMVAEDALDRYTIRGIERRTDSRVLRALARGFLNPTRSFANMMRWKAPWHRDGRPLAGGVVADQAAPDLPASGSGLGSGPGTLSPRSGHK